jgi:ATP phosphoribosyltransferase
MVIKIALPNKGSLADLSAQMLRDAGYRQRVDQRDLVFLDPNNDVEFYYLRPRDIAIYVGNGNLDIGITGKDLLIDSGANSKAILDLGFGNSTFRFATKVSEANPEIKDLSGKRIGTAYPGLLKEYLIKQSISADIVPLDGAVESSIQLGVADYIADVVSTGGTLRAAGLKAFGEPILQSEAVLVTSKDREINREIEKIIHRLNGVIIARQYVLVDYDIENENLSAAIKITPGIESPTISPLAKPGWNAVRSMVKKKDINVLMDELWEIGARGILVTDIHACRL